MEHYSSTLLIRKRHKIIRNLLRKGIKPARILKRLRKIEDGKYAVSWPTLSRDIKEIVKQTQNWDKIHNPHQQDIYQQKRQALIDELDVLIRKAKKRHQFKTAGDLLTKKARLLGVDKFIAPKAKKKDELEEKYKNKTQEQINDELFHEFRSLAATILRMIKDRKMNNVVAMTVRVTRKDERGKKTKYILTRYGEEKKLQVENK